MESHSFPSFKPRQERLQTFQLVKIPERKQHRGRNRENRENRENSEREGSSSGGNQTRGPEEEEFRVEPLKLINTPDRFIQA